VLIVDEAQQLSADVLEQLRLLTNLETSSAKLLQIVLIGQPELQTLMGRSELRQLAQRITARYHLGALSRDESAAYVRHRLELAGRVAPLFTPAAFRRIHRLSGGVPRLINVICDRALLGAYGKGIERVGPGLVARAAAEVRGEGARPRRWARALAVLVLLAAALGTGAWWASFRPAPAAPSAPRAPGGLAVPGGPGTPSAPSDWRALLRGESEEGAFRALFAQWGLRDRDLGGVTPCDRADSAGLRCLAGVGGWADLREFDLPAVIELVAGSLRGHAVVTALDADRVTLRLGGRRLALPVQEVAAFWTGRYTLFLRPPPFGDGVLQVGRAGPPVLWLRGWLDRLEPEAVRAREAAPSERFDEDLRRRVMAFQHRHGLRPDGKVGMQTAIQLTRAAGDPPVPSLLRGS
jgi:general secretion pathway protein A